MRVGFLTYGLDRAPTGIGRYAVELLRALAALPDQLELVLLTTEREDRLGLWDIFEHHALPGCRLLPALMTVGNIMLAHAAHRYRLDVVHDPNGIAPFLAPRGPTRRIVTIHDAVAYVYPATHNRLDNWRYHAMLPWAVQRADMVLTDSQHSLRDLKRYLNVPDRSIRYIHCGIDGRFAPVPETSERANILSQYGIAQPYLFYVGGINGRKNIARLFEAYAEVRKHHPQLMLVIGGKRQWQTSEIDTTLYRLDLQHHIHFTGYVDDAHLPALYSGAEAFVFPSLYEGFGFPPLEAMACGTPVITSTASSLPEVVGDAALLIDPYDVGALIAAIEQVVTDPTLRTELRERGLKRVSTFTWAHTAQKTLAAYIGAADAATDGTDPPRVGPGI
ncbi:MAG: glycosyltransferase family 1 protein [Herpetosiphon sp.]